MWLTIASLFTKTVIPSLVKYWKPIAIICATILIAFYIYLDYKESQGLREEISRLTIENVNLDLELEEVIKTNETMYNAYITMKQEVAKTQLEASALAQASSKLRVDLNTTKKSLDGMRDRDSTLLAKPVWTAKLITKSYQEHLDKLACATGNKQKCK